MGVAIRFGVKVRTPGRQGTDNYRGGRVFRPWPGPPGYRHAMDVRTSCRCSADSSLPASSIRQVVALVEANLDGCLQRRTSGSAAAVTAPGATAG